MVVYGKLWSRAPFSSWDYILLGSISSVRQMLTMVSKDAPPIPRYETHLLHTL